MQVIVTNELTCPQCLSTEVREDGMLNIRAFKVEIDGIWHSQCLVCLAAGKPNKGWFCTEFQ